MSEKVNIEICAGYRAEHKGDNWIRHDIREYDGIGILCDVWELPSNVPGNAKVVSLYSKNFLEHLTTIEGKFFIRQCWNMLEVGGTLEFAVPNLDWLCKKYADGGFPDPFDFLAWIFGGTGDEWWNVHKTMYNDALMMTRLQEGGFEADNITISGVDEYFLKAVAIK